MNGYTDFPGWVVQIGEALAPALMVFGLVINRADRLNDTIRKNHETAMACVEEAKTESAEALAAATARFDSRHEALRRELTTQVGFVLDRINSLADTMARREDFVGISARIDGLNARMDKMLDR